MENDILLVGSTGHFIAAVMETAGLYGQGQILTNFYDLLVSTGGLLYTFCVAGAVISVALFGNYKQASYLFIGPAIFYFMLTNQSQVTATSQRFGNAALDPQGNGQLHALRESGDENRYEKPATVATFFVFYDNLVSSIIRQTVAFIVETNNNEFLTTTMRENVYKRLARQRGDDNQEYMKLVSLALTGDCARQVMIKKTLSMTPFVNADPKKDEAAYNKKLKLLAEFRAIEHNTVKIDQSLKQFVEKLSNKPFVTNAKCSEIWQWVGNASIVIARNLLKPRPDELNEHPEVNWDRTYRFVIQKLLPTKEGQGDVAQIDEAKVERAARILAAFILRNSIGYSVHGALTTQMAGRESWHPHLFQRTYGDRQAAEASAERLRIVYFAGYVPYIQGVLLYLLAVTFPFFVIFFLMPGRVSAFFVWMTLWLWVKSWDIGFALVHFTRTVFWKLMPHVGDMRSVDNAGGMNWDDASTIFNIAYLNDPTANHNTYYTIIGLLTLSVPIITAHLCMGATNLYGMLKTGIDGTADRFRDDKSTMARNRYSNDLFKQIHGEIMVTGHDAAVQAGRKENLGSTSAGVSRISASAGGTVGRYQRGESDKAKFEFQYSEYMTELQSGIGAMSPRRMPYNQIGSTQLLDRDLNLLTEKYTSPNFTQAQLGGALRDWRNAGLDVRKDTKTNRLGGAGQGPTRGDSDADGD